MQHVNTVILAEEDTCDFTITTVSENSLANHFVQSTKINKVKRLIFLYRNSPGFKSFEEKVETTVSTIKVHTA